MKRSLYMKRSCPKAKSLIPPGDDLHAGLVVVMKDVQARAQDRHQDLFGFQGPRCHLGLQVHGVD